MAVKAKLKSGTDGQPELGAEAVAWPTVEHYLERDDRVIVPVGSQEQHGRHLPLGVDWMIPYGLGRLVSARTGVFCVSPVCYGMSWLHSAFPGTVPLKPATLSAVYTDIIEELYAQGFRRMLVLNGHGGNTNALNAALSVLVRQADDLRVKVFDWWRVLPVQEICVRAFGALDSHAGPAETSVMLHLFPDAVHTEAAADDSSDLLPHFPNPRQIRERYPDGVMQNNATQANAAVGGEIVDAVVSFLEDELNAGGPNGEW